MTEEEKEQKSRKERAEAKKVEGNAFYKKKDFVKALELYNEAVEIDPTEINYYNNIAAVYFQMEKY